MPNTYGVIGIVSFSVAKPTYSYTASPPMPPPRRGSESVPGSPHNFRTARIHYTPEPQRHAYRTVDQ